MKIARIALLIAALAMVVGVLPASASTPAACEGRAYPVDLAADETLVESTLYLTGSTQVGTVDGFNDPTALQMVEDAPTAEAQETKVYWSRPANLGTPSQQGNAFLGAWHGELDVPSRVVCASVEFWAAGVASAINVQLFGDSGGPANEFNATAATTSPEGIRHYEGTFGNVEMNAWDILVQFNPSGPGGAPILYDSAEYPSALTVVTVEKS